MQHPFRTAVAVACTLAALGLVGYCVFINVYVPRSLYDEIEIGMSKRRMDEILRREPMEVDHDAVHDDTVLIYRAYKASVVISVSNETRRVTQKGWWDHAPPSPDYIGWLRGE
jgi:hypothetical protein